MYKQNEIIKTIIKEINGKPCSDTIDNMIYELRDKNIIPYINIKKLYIMRYEHHYDKGYGIEDSILLIYDVKGKIGYIYTHGVNLIINSNKSYFKNNIAFLDDVSDYLFSCGEFSTTYFAVQDSYYRDIYKCE